MAQLTEMDRIRMLLSDPARAPMTMEQVLSEEIKEFKASDAYKIMAQGQEYYRNRSSVQEKTNSVTTRTNTKIEHPILKKLVDQKANYLLSKPFTVETGNQVYGEMLNELFTPAFRQEIKALGKQAVKSGVAWIQPYFEDGKLAFMRLPSTEVIPLWKDAAHTKLDAFIRFYEQTYYEGNRKCKRVQAEFWYDGGVKWFTSVQGGAFTIDKEHGDERRGWTQPHFYYNGKPYNWAQIPLAWVRYNEDELPLCYYIQDLIDDINWQTSVTADVLRDISKFVYVLKEYGGQDLAGFVRDLREHLAIQVDSGGGVDKLQADLNIDAVMAFLDKQRRDIFDFACAVDTKDPDLGNASGSAINFRYMDLDADCASLGMEIKAAFQTLKPFIDVYFQIAGFGDFTGETFDILFNMDLPVNETDVINNVRASEGILSQRTLLQNHPWVRDAEEELAWLEKEKKQAMESFGEGLFLPPGGGENALEGRALADGNA